MAVSDLNGFLLHFPTGAHILLCLLLATSLAKFPTSSDLATAASWVFCV